MPDILCWNINSLTNHSIILDVDETLVHTFGEESIDPAILDSLNPTCRSRIYLFTEDDFSGNGDKSYACYGILRPGAEGFMNFCFSYFRNVIFWSAGADTYVRKIV